MHQLSHCATVVCECAAEAAHSFLADATKLGSWALGCWNAQPIAEHTVQGTSLFDGETSVVRISAKPDLIVDYIVEDMEASVGPRISARVVPGVVVGLSQTQCLVTLVAWRTLNMSDDRWAQLTASHDVEVLLVKAGVEAL
jgi:hypothetical protein